MPKILIVEDNEMNRDMLSRRLARRGYEIAIAVDGEQGLAMAQAEAPALILMDISLPGLDGWEATRRLKAMPETRGVPVIALTAHAMAGDREKAVAAGCDDFDTKPVDLNRLLEKIEALLGRADGAGASIRPPSCATSCAPRSTTSSATPSCSSRTSRTPPLRSPPTCNRCSPMAATSSPG